MTQLLVGDDARFEVSSVEIDRGGLSYTVDTLRTLAAVRPSAELYWLVGADVLQSFAKWKEPAEIVKLATLVVMQRAGGESPDIAALPAQPRLLATRRIDISSTEIRERVRQEKSIRGFVPDAVAAYISAERLYR
jgi:nicotinate-nucleotide adenylyltransferase